VTLTTHETGGITNSDVELARTISTIAEPIFLGLDGRRMDRYAADRTVNRFERPAGITKRISPHSLQQSFITAAV